MTRLMDPPSHAAIVEAVRQHGSFQKAAKALGISDYWLRSQLARHPDLKEEVVAIRNGKTYHGNDSAEVKPGDLHLNVKQDQMTLVYSTDNPELGAIGELIRGAGMDPDEWLVTNVTLNKWEGMTSPQWDEAAGEKRNQKMPLNQWKVTLARKPHLILAAPAIPHPPLKRKPLRLTLDKPELILVEGDHQIPYNCKPLHVARLYMLEELAKRHNLVEQDFLGDTLDLPTISAHRDHPAAMAAVNECIQGGYNVLRDNVDAAPNIRRRKLKGNHDWRIEAELLGRAERMYGIRPATRGEVEELPALSLQRLLHLDALGVELVEDPRGWQHAEIELVPGMAGLVVRHGWLTSANSAAKSLAKRGRSMIVGHTHRPEHHFVWDPSAELERQAVTAGTMSEVRGGGSKQYPHFVPLDTWLQGFITVTRWPDGRFAIEHARWTGTALRWRDKEWTA